MPSCFPAGGFSVSPAAPAQCEVTLQYRPMLVSGYWKYSRPGYAFSVPTFVLDLILQIGIFGPMVRLLCGYSTKCDEQIEATSAML